MTRRLMHIDTWIHRHEAREAKRNGRETEIEKVCLGVCERTCVKSHTQCIAHAVLAYQRRVDIFQEYNSFIVCFTLNQLTPLAFDNGNCFVMVNIKHPLQ